MEGHALSWPQERRLAVLKDQVSAMPLADATERVPPMKTRWRATVPRGRDPKPRPQDRRDGARASRAALLTWRPRLR